jgi:hypothetical protein
MRSAAPLASSASAPSGALKRFVAMTGNRVAALMRAETQPNAPRGTMPAMVGTRASCQPMPVLSSVAPAPSICDATHSASAPVPPPSTRSSPESRKMMMKFRPVAARVFATVSSATRARFGSDPPHSSSREFVRGARNSLMK